MSIKWIKPNGNEIETNDLPATVDYCESLGWKRNIRGESRVDEAEPVAESAAGETSPAWAPGDEFRDQGPQVDEVPANEPEPENGRRRPAA